MRDKKIFKYLELKGLYNQLVHKRCDVSEVTDKAINKKRRQWENIKNEDYFYTYVFTSSVKLEVI
jgi:hypothetical protein